MLIQTISFEIHNFETSVSELFVMENTIDNQEMVFSHRYTRNIQFGQMFTFQFEKEMAMPLEFVTMDTWMRLLGTSGEVTAPVADLQTV